MTAPRARRPGRRLDLDVPSTLVEIAERMFGEAGVDIVSVRAVAREAGVAPAAVFYHFASKEDLVAAVVERRGPAVSEAMRANLVALSESRAKITVREVIDAVLTPLVHVIDSDPVAGLNWMKVVDWLGVTRDSAFYDGPEIEPGINAMFASLVGRATGRRSQKVGRRYGIAMYGMLHALARVDLYGYGGAIGPAGLDPEWVEQLAAFTAGGLEAP
jgi:AcrR family transcriptional regulator